MGRFHRHDNGSREPDHDQVHQHHVREHLDHEHVEHKERDRGHRDHEHVEHKERDRGHQHDDLDHPEHEHQREVHDARAHVHTHGHDREHEVGDHTAYATGTARVAVLTSIFAENDAAAQENRAAFDAAGVVVINLMSAPGAGKTTVLAATLAWCRDAGIRAGVVEGDIETSLDADRLSGFGAQVSLLNTGAGFGGECHLDAPMVARALRGLDLARLDVLFVENVGNLVCPAEFDVGAHHSVMVYAITEGEEKPLKYPVMFRACELVLLNKVDLVPYLDADPADFRANLARVNPAATVLPVSSRDAASYEPWYSWLSARLGAPPVTGPN